MLRTTEKLPIKDPISMNIISSTMGKRNRMYFE